MKKSNLQKQSLNANTDYVFDIQQRLLKLKRAEPTLIHLRDGELVLYRRAGSHFWHCSFKLQNKNRVRTTTKKMSIEQAIPQACLIYVAAEKNNVVAALDNYFSKNPKVDNKKEAEVVESLEEELLVD